MNDECSCIAVDRQRVRRMGLGGKLSFGNFDTTGKHCQTRARILNEGRGVGVVGGGQPAGFSVSGQRKVVEVVNNKLIRNGSKIAMDERPDRQDPEKKKPITEQ